MVLALEEKPAQDTKIWIESQCDQLLRQWMLDLDEEEKQTWLWNSMVEIKRIMARRNR